MAVIERAVHDSTKIEADHRVGCWNAPRPGPAAGYFAPNREYHPDGSFTVGVQWIPFVMSRECRYDQKAAPQQCAGCQWQADSAQYDAQVRADGSA